MTNISIDISGPPRIAGDPAFPCTLPNDSGVPYGFPGMYLRDYFAGQIACGDAMAEDGWATDAGKQLILGRVRMYYRIADAMLEVRGEK